MGFTAQAGQVILKTQTTPGTFDPATGTDGVAVKLRSGALGTNRELLAPDPEIGGGRDASDAYLGPVSWSGDYEFYARMPSLATMLKACLGSASKTGTGDATEHTIIGSDTSLPLLSIEEKVGNGFEVFNYYDAVVNSLHLEAEANGYLQGTVSIIAPRQEAGKTATATPAWDTTPMTVGTNIQVEHNGVTIPAKSFSLDINNNFEDDDFRLGSLYLGDLTAKGREVTAGFSVRQKDSGLWRMASYGSPTAVVPGGVVAAAPLKITCQTYEKIGATANAYKLEINIPVFKLRPFSQEASGDDILESDIEGQAFRPVLGTPIMTVKAMTGSPGIA